MTCPFTFRGTACGYDGPVHHCDKSLEDCMVKQHAEHFAGFTGIPTAIGQELINSPMVRAAKASVAVAFNGYKMQVERHLTREDLESIIIAALKTWEVTREPDDCPLCDGDHEDI